MAITVRMRDGIGLVGPLVIPGVTNCLVNPWRDDPATIKRGAPTVSC